MNCDHLPHTKTICYPKKHSSSRELCSQRVKPPLSTELNYNGSLESGWDSELDVQKSWWGFFVCVFWGFFSVTIPQSSSLWSHKNSHAERGEGLYFLAAVLVYASLRSLWNCCSRLKSQICTRRKDTEVNDFTSEMNLNNGAHLLIGSWDAQRHKHDGLSYQAEAFMREIENSYLHCWLSYKLCKNVDLCTVCFMQRVQKHTNVPEKKWMNCADKNFILYNLWPVICCCLNRPN